ncbi:hypothetical protein N9O87_02810 [Gammaproteobacteria bacterium]|nr:hypothetical protein [Gammaproteobacteria bacterium]
MMQENKVFEWKVFVRFVERKFELVSDLASHPVLDAIAEDLVTGRNIKKLKPTHR